MKRLLLIFALLLSPVLHAAPPNLILAKEYSGQNIAGWAMSEKLDGVRAYWDGQKLISRQGHPFSPPAGFTRDFPPFPLDGELYSRHGAFEQISATVRRSGSDWSGIKLHVFDAPQAPGNLYQRLELVRRHLAAHPRANIALIPQTPARNIEHARQFLRQIENQGGEGVMLRNPDTPYQGGRSSNLLKLKSAHDAECTVTAHHEGKGRNTGLLGAVSCRNELGEFRIGSGFKDADRRNPPPHRQPHHLQIPRLHRQRHPPLRHLPAPCQLNPKPPARAKGYLKTMSCEARLSFCEAKTQICFQVAFRQPAAALPKLPHQPFAMPYCAVSLRLRL